MRSFPTSVASSIYGPVESRRTHTDNVCIITPALSTHIALVTGGLVGGGGWCRMVFTPSLVNQKIAIQLRFRRPLCEHCTAGISRIFDPDPTAHDFIWIYAPLVLFPSNHSRLTSCTSFNLVKPPLLSFLYVDTGPG
ncbi:hypothetical protein AG1IA_00280 [Rhizoctonia solani AG-1 IA]|uniref:Uncharacterized protein n=1 Tax=Thanatephorus cucumeris (strain AG1-IA) TaxID=983506 RepID=L8X5V4_THACA|nr:hypothetical protein AG1IA_00280 [Rhizoctonia solani AG-1 IA]